MAAASNRRRMLAIVALLAIVAGALLGYSVRRHLARIGDWTRVIVLHELAGSDAIPATTWPTKDPASVGLHTERLEEFRRAIGRYSSGVVIVDGALVFAWGRPHANGEWGSASKSMYTTLLLFAIEEGRLESADAPIAPYVGGLAEADRGLTFRHLADMTSGYSLPEGSGEAWAYNDYAAKLLFNAVTKGLFGIAPTDAGALEREVLAPHRLGPLGFEDGELFTVWNDTARVNKSPRDFARVGLFWMNRGVWDGRRILSESLFDTYHRVGVPADLPRTAGGAPDDYLQLDTAGAGNDHLALGPGSFGFMLWFNEGGKLWPDLPEDAFQANGHENREALTVIPSRGMVVAWIHGWKVADPGGRFPQKANEALAILLEEAPRPSGASG